MPTRVVVMVNGHGLVSLISVPQSTQVRMRFLVTISRIMSKVSIIPGEGGPPLLTAAAFKGGTNAERGI